LFSRISFSERIKEAVMGEVHLIEQARAESMRFGKGQIVGIDGD